MSPARRHALHKDIRAARAVAQEVLVVGQSSTSFTVELRELDVVQKVTSLYYIREATERVVKVLQRRSKES